jgi:DNA-binding response OmpR family regulator
MNMQKKVLIVEDEPDLATILKYIMEGEGWSADVEYNGESALSYIENSRPDIVILDIMLPKINGFEVCNQIRRFTTIPVLILSARIQPEDIIKGLEIGADDYMTKPFNHRELVLRVKKILNRESTATSIEADSQELKIGGIEISLSAKSVLLNGVEVAVTPIEYKLLSCLAINEGRILSWESLVKEVWGHDDWNGGDKLVKVSIGRLRKKLEGGSMVDADKYIVNVWGMGYKLVNPAT